MEHVYFDLDHSPEGRAAYEAEHDSVDEDWDDDEDDGRTAFVSEHMCIVGSAGEVAIQEDRWARLPAAFRDGLCAALEDGTSSLSLYGSTVRIRPGEPALIYGVAADIIRRRINLAVKVAAAAEAAWT